jgi:hypothetical protein
VIRTSRRIRGIFVFSGSELLKKSEIYSGVDKISRPIQWYHSHADPTWPDGAFKISNDKFVFFPLRFLFLRTSGLWSL